LWAAYHLTENADSTKLNMLSAILMYDSGEKSDTSGTLVKSIHQLIAKIKDHKYLSKKLLELGVFETNHSRSHEALGFENEALRICEEMQDKPGIADCKENIGNIYFDQTDYPVTMKYYLEALKLDEELHDKYRLGKINNNLGNLYDQLNDLNKALDYYLKSLKICEELSDHKGIVDSYINLGLVYADIGDSENVQKAISFYNKAIALCDPALESKELGQCYSAMAQLAYNNKEYDRSLELFMKDLEIDKLLNDRRGLAGSYNNIGEVFCGLGNYKKAILYSDSSLILSQQLGDLETQELVYENLSEVYAAMGNYQQAYTRYKLYKGLHDSIFNIANSKQLGGLKTKFEVERKEAEMLIRSDAEKKISKEQQARQQFILYAVAAGLFVVFVFSVFLYRRVKITQRQKAIIEEQKILVEEKNLLVERQKAEVEQQKHLVEEHQKEIIDSITYAKRLQEAILPSVGAVKGALPNSFIYYQPKAIVAGDFYWMHTTADFIYIAAADCTGHGVPGAMVSVVCSNSLNRAVKEFSLTDTGAILDKTRELVVETFEKSDEQVSDGMDISLMRIGKAGEDKVSVQWSGANNPLWYHFNEELIEVKADKQPIGKYAAPRAFTTHHFEHPRPVSYYLFSDGYADQFSPIDKKLMKKQFKAIISSIRDKAMDEQLRELERVHVNWKGAMEQTDDVLVIGIKF